MMTFNMSRLRTTISTFTLVVASVLLCGRSSFGEGEPTESKGPLVFTEPTILKAVEVDVPPMLDGMAFDRCWRKAPPVTLWLDNGGKRLPVELKACVCDGRIYLLVRYQAGKEARSHRPWHWDPKRKIYVSGDEREETLYLALRLADAKRTDVWAWRAGRTDSVGFAEDMSVVDGKLRVDSGRGCWYSEYLGGFAGDVVPRFMNRAPSGSVSDVKARGDWDKGRLTIELSRKLDTRNRDDIILGKILLVAVARVPGS